MKCHEYIMEALGIVHCDISHSSASNSGDGRTQVALSLDAVVTLFLVQVDEMGYYFCRLLLRSPPSALASVT
ncbi:hypothetical protein RB195_012147 [Necator americanus]